MQVEKNSGHLQGDETNLLRVKMADLLLRNGVRRGAKLGEVAVRTSVHDQHELVDRLERGERQARFELLYS